MHPIDAGRLVIAFDLLPRIVNLGHPVKWRTQLALQLCFADEHIRT
jgi:hypothetical protein